MSTDQFPIRVSIEVMVTDGKTDGWASGPECFGRLPSKEELVAMLADSLLSVQEQIGGKKGAKFRLPSPSELMTSVATAKLGIQVAEVLAAPRWGGFTAEELEAALATEKAKRAAAEKADR